MNLVNTNRLRVTLRRQNPGYGERFCYFHLNRYASRDHGKPRAESNVNAQVLGMVCAVKWRPDGK